MRSRALASAGFLVALPLAACGSDSAHHAESPAQAAPAAGPAHEALTTNRWRVQVSVRPSRMGPIAFAARDLARANPSNSHPWIVHDLVFRNTGDRPVSFADTRSSEFARGPGHRQLLVGDEGCGYALNRPGAPARAGACLANLDVLVVKPHASARRSITLYKGLQGMNRLSAGTYLFRREVRFQPGARPPDAGDRRSAVVTLAYRISPRSG